MIGLYEKITSLSYFITHPVWMVLARLEGKDGVWSYKLGNIPEKVLESGPFDLWLHAVSVGEVGVAEALVDAIEGKGKKIRILVSSTTPAGFAKALSSLGKRCTVIPYPLDFPQVVKRVISSVKPKVYACLETELWPNLLQNARRAGCKTILLNGRISERSYPKYLKLRGLTRPILSGFSKIAAISDIHADRLKALGADEENIVVTGNAKFEALLTRPDPKRVELLRNRTGIRPSGKVVVAGSIRGDEGKIMVKAYERLRGKWADLTLFLVPRHVERVPGLEKYLNERRISYNLWSELETGGDAAAQVIIVDVIGPLFDLYGLADVAFVGGSMVPKGGQNVMEPAAWRCPVLFGPHTENFEEASHILKRYKGGTVVRNLDDLVEQLGALLGDPDFCCSMGAAARSALEKLSQNAASRQAEIVLKALECE